MSRIKRGWLVVASACLRQSRHQGQSLELAEVHSCFIVSQLAVALHLIFSSSGADSESLNANIGIIRAGSAINRGTLNNKAAFVSRFLTFAMHPLSIVEAILLLRHFASFLH